MNIQELGVTSAASTISYLDNAVVYVGSSYGDSQLVKLNGAPDANGSYVEVRRLSVRSFLVGYRERHETDRNCRYEDSQLVKLIGAQTGCIWRGDDACSPIADGKTERMRVGASLLPTGSLGTDLSGVEALRSRALRPLLPQTLAAQQGGLQCTTRLLYPPC